MQWSLATIALVPRGTTRHAPADKRRGILDWAARTGFTGIEVSPHWLDIDSTRVSELAGFRREAAAAGLAISGINVNRCLFTRGPRADESLNRVRRAIEAAAALEAPVVTLSLSLALDANPRPLLRGYDISSEERQRAAEILSELAFLAAADGIQLSLELHDDGMLDTAEHCLEMVRSIGVPNVGVNPDLGNLVRSSLAPVAWESALAQLAPPANNWHVKNYRGTQPAPLWDGDIDYARAVGIMQAANYSGWVSIESYFGDVLDLQTRSLAYMRQLVTAPTGAANAQRGSVA